MLLSNSLKARRESFIEKLNCQQANRRQSYVKELAIQIGEDEDVSRAYLEAEEWLYFRALESYRADKANGLI